MIVDPDDGERTMYTDRGANLGLGVEDLPDELLDGVGLLHVSGYSLFDAAVRSAVLDLVARARRRDLPVAVDPASIAFLREIGPDRSLDWIGDVDLLFPNLDEGRLLTGEHDAEVVATALLSHAEVVALKLGEEGAIVVRRDGNHPCRVPAVASEVVDTTGSGDAFCGAFLAGWLAGEGDAQLLEAAVAAGARAAGVAGARPR